MSIGIETLPNDENAPKREMLRIRCSKEMKKVFKSLKEYYRFRYEADLLRDMIRHYDASHRTEFI